MLTRYLAQKDPVRERRQWTGAALDHLALAQGQGKLARHQEANVDDPSAQLGQTALEVGALECAADEDSNRGQRIVLLRLLDLRRERFLERRGVPVTSRRPAEPEAPVSLPPVTGASISVVLRSGKGLSYGSGRSPVGGFRRGGVELRNQTLIERVSESRRELVIDQLNSERRGGPSAVRWIAAAYVASCSVSPSSCKIPRSRASWRVGLPPESLPVRKTVSNRPAVETS